MTRDTDDLPLFFWNTYRINSVPAVPAMNWDNFLTLENFRNEYVRYFDNKLLANEVFDDLLFVAAGTEFVNKKILKCRMLQEYNRRLNKNARVYEQKRTETLRKNNETLRRCR